MYFCRRGKEGWNDPPYPGGEPPSGGLGLGAIPAVLPSISASDFVWGAFGQPVKFELATFIRPSAGAGRVQVKGQEGSGDTSGRRTGRMRPRVGRRGEAVSGNRAIKDRKGTTNRSGAFPALRAGQAAKQWG